MWKESIYSSFTMDSRIQFTTTVSKCNEYVAKQRGDSFIYTKWMIFVISMNLFSWDKSNSVLLCFWCYSIQLISSVDTKKFDAFEFRVRLDSLMMCIRFCYKIHISEFENTQYLAVVFVFNFTHRVFIYDMNDAISYNLLIHFIMIKFIIIFGTYSVLVAFFCCQYILCALTHNITLARLLSISHRRVCCSFPI